MTMQASITTFFTALSHFFHRSVRCSRFLFQWKQAALSLLAVLVGLTHAVHSNAQALSQSPAALQSTAADGSGLPKASRANLTGLLVPSQGGPASDSYANPQVQAQLWAHAPQPVAAGQTIWLGLRLLHAPGWHTYWQNAGDSGLPTRLTWQLPPGLKVGPIQWPAPQAIRLGSLTNFGFEGEVNLLSSVKVGAGFMASQTPLLLKLKAEWLICRTECIPQEAEFSLSLPRTGTGDAQADVFERAQATWPLLLKGAKTSEARLGLRPLEAGSKPKTAEQRQALQLTWQGLPPAWQGQALQIFAEQAGVFQSQALPAQTWQGADWSAQLPLGFDRETQPKTLRFVLRPALPAAAGNTEQAAPIQVQTAVSLAWTKPPEQWPLLPVLSPNVALAVTEPSHGKSPGDQAASSSARVWGDSSFAIGAATSGFSASLILALFSALLGGLLLNLMPCVFPILALKVLAFAELGAAADQDPSTRAQVRWSGLAYTLGVVLSFVLLGALLLGLRALGEGLGWGFQLQSPWVLCALAVLFCLLALNLWGFLSFDFLNRWLPSALVGAQWRHPAWNAALSGVLAVWVAAPCTAPFMGASLGLAMTLPNVAALTIFAALGLGLALPFLLISFVPRAMAWLPRPGAWMERFRRAMAWPMWATLLWLIWVLGQVTGLDVVIALLLLLLILCAAVWAAAEARDAGVRVGLRRLLSLGFGLLLCWLIWGLILQVRTSQAEPAAAPVVAQSLNAVPTNAAAPALPASPLALTWQPWSAAAVTQAQARGQTVLVDFTAAWCLSCQYNKKMVLETPEFLQLAANRQVLLLRADWTRRDERIGAEITRLGRSGVPVYAVYRPGVAPKVLGEILSFKELSLALP
jgi:thiol:disulfide interchange protein